MASITTLDGVALLPRSGVGRRLVRIRVRRQRAALDAALAQGANPWSTPELLTRASRLGSLAERRRIASGLHRLVALAALRRRASPFVGVRHRVVLEHRDPLLVLAERIFQPEPVEVRVIAQLALLLSESSSPVYAGGGDPRSLTDVINRCLDRVSTDAAT